MLEWNSNGVIVDCRNVDTANNWGVLDMQPENIVKVKCEVYEEKVIKK